MLQFASPLFLFCQCTLFHVPKKHEGPTLYCKAVAEGSTKVQSLKTCGGENLTRNMALDPFIQKLSKILYLPVVELFSPFISIN